MMLSSAAHSKAPPREGSGMGGMGKAPNMMAATSYVGNRSPVIEQSTMDRYDAGKCVRWLAAISFLHPYSPAVAVLHQLLQSHRCAPVAKQYADLSPGRQGQEGTHRIEEVLESRSNLPNLPMPFFTHLNCPLAPLPLLASPAHAQRMHLLAAPCNQIV